MRRAGRSATARLLLALLCAAGLAACASALAGCDRIVDLTPDASEPDGAIAHPDADDGGAGFDGPGDDGGFTPDGGAAVDAAAD